MRKYSTSVVFVGNSANVTFSETFHLKITFVNLSDFSVFFDS